MLGVRIEIGRFIDAAQPGWVECALVDARGRRHLFREKVPIVSSETLDESSSYPRAGAIACTPVGPARREAGREIVTVETEMPWGVESTEGVTRFEVLPEQLVELETGA